MALQSALAKYLYGFSKVNITSFSPVRTKMEQVRNPLSLDPVGYRGKDL